MSGTRPFAGFEWLIALRYLRARRRERAISAITGFSLVGIMLGVATLIVVMSVMNGFRDELVTRILGVNGHVLLLPVGRTLEEPEALDELATSILQQGLRNPVEVYDMETPRGAFRYALVSGARRLAAFERLHYMTGQERWTSIPAWLRAPETGAEALALMVTENAVREDVSPWEKGRIVVKARDNELFATLDEAVKGLFPAVERTKASRIREAALAVEAFDGCFAEPWRLSMRQCLRLANAERDGAGELIAHVLEEERAKTLEAQWALVEPILAEIETPPAANAPKRKEGYPRRLKHIRPDLTIRREKTKHGYALHFTGKYAQDRLMEDVLDDVIRRFEPVE